MGSIRGLLVFCQPVALVTLGSSNQRAGMDVQSLVLVRGGGNGGVDAADSAEAAGDVRLNCVARLFL